MDILNKIFEVCLIKIENKEYRLKYTLSAVLWLESKGIKLETLGKSLQSTPQTTIFLLAFAGLPKDQFRESITFDNWIEKLSKEDTTNILKKVDVLLEVFYKDLGVRFEKIMKEKSPENLKKKLKKSLIKKLLILLFVGISLVIWPLVS